MLQNWVESTDAVPIGAALITATRWQQRASFPMRHYGIQRLNKMVWWPCPVSLVLIIHHLSLSASPIFPEPTTTYISLFLPIPPMGMIFKYTFKGKLELIQSLCLQPVANMDCQWNTNLKDLWSTYLWGNRGIWKYLDSLISKPLSQVGVFGIHLLSTQ